MPPSEGYILKVSVVPTSDDTSTQTSLWWLVVKDVHPSVYVLHNSEGSEDTCTQVSLKCLLAMINLLKDYCSAS